jgi:hypothetical protein
VTGAAVAGERRTRSEWNPCLRAWCTAKVARAAILVLAMAAMVVLSAPAQAAAPNYILVTGPGLARPVLLANWTENLDLLLAVANAPKASRTTVRGLTRRPRLDLAEFWAWSGRPRPTSPRQANQHGQFYPAHRSQPPVIVMMANGVSAARLAPTHLLKILARHGVPTHL